MQETIVMANHFQAFSAKKYLKIKWPESRGDQYDDWGTSTWLVEIDESNNTTRHIEVYSNGNRLKYSSDHKEDKFGKLNDQVLDENELGAEMLSKTEYEKEWNKEAFND